MANFTRNLRGMLDKTRHAVDRGHPLNTVTTAVFKEEAQYLRTDQPDIAAAAAAAVHFYSRLTAPMMRNIVSRGARASTTAPSFASHIPTAIPTDESSTPSATQGPIALEGSWMSSSPVAMVAPHTVAIAASAVANVDRARVGTSAGPTEPASTVTCPSLSLGVKAETMPAAVGASSSFLGEQGGSESQDTITEALIPGLSRVSGGQTKARRLRKKCDVCFYGKVRRASLATVA